MMISIRNLSVLMCLVLLAGNLFAGGFALTGVGSRATSMAGAFRGLSDDPSAMYWNPAGMGFMNENSVHLGGNFYSAICHLGSQWLTDDLYPRISEQRV